MSPKDDGILQHKMKKREYSAFQAAKSSKTRKDQKKKFFYDAEPVKRLTMEVNTHIATQIDDIKIDRFALSILEMTMPEWVPEKLQDELKESLRGFSEWAALWIAESLADCCRGKALATIGIPHIDNMLWSLYTKILNCARQQGVKIANHV
jgi:hypothetical protein